MTINSFKKSLQSTSVICVPNFPPKIYQTQRPSVIQPKQNNYFLNQFYRIIMETQNSPIFMHLDLIQFKTQPCKKKKCHKAKTCMNYHFPSEKRRSLKNFKYGKVVCPDKKECKNGDYCEYSHNFIEQIYHPDNYKKKYCKDFIQKQLCKFGSFCALAHSDFELKIKPLHLMEIDENFLLFYFKSEFCPFSKIPHDRFTCVYAHNWQDFKRPYFKTQRPMICPFWDTEKEIVNYQEGCPHDMTCENCHGWKEYEYHVDNFKKVKCNNQKCERKQICSFLHSNVEQQKSVFNSKMFFPVKKNLNHGNTQIIDYLQYINIKIPKNSWLSSQSTLHSKQKHFYNLIRSSNLSGLDSQNSFFQKNFQAKSKPEIDQFQLESKSEQNVLKIDHVPNIMDIKTMSMMNNPILKQNFSPMQFGKQKEFTELDENESSFEDSDDSQKQQSSEIQNDLKNLTLQNSSEDFRNQRENQFMF